ncbi:ABC transporter substrate-binding protein [Nocardioides sp. Root1257]|uniref:ABC transporter substrate-binding protein n=1 Tax=unclassified Nocardioides TaxID=2615069 RepID=UPI0006F6668C|nr:MULTISPECIES: ABC transporter substrate-binding protein [unclassified Nocardioides]KQW43051.1 ABC transporter substrate-binding protein [Nocardioides sp. Root1257]KRC41919.1 ABC transporter substrate-binding protein [Nocardioides sp. Root224]
MFTYRKRVLAATAAIALAGGLAACGGSDSSSDGKAGGGPTSSATGGTLNYLIFAPIEHVDPQRIYVGRDITNFSRTVYRQLVTFPISTDPKVSNTPVADLATDTGTSSDGGKVWSFTVKDGVKWEDGQPITCEDFKYGASRVFATDVITGGPNYLLSYLDIPTDSKTGLPAYDGPYKGDGQDLFDKAITCDGNTITYNFNKPWPDFPLAIAALHMMDPYRQDKDNGDKSNFQIFSNGPYKLDGAWSKNKGATLVRNDNYDPKTDDPENIRRALPDSIVFNIGQTTETIYDQLIADTGDAQTAVTSQRVPAPYFNQIEGAVADRATLEASPYVDYLVPNFRKMSDPKVREALKVATNAQAWIDAGGGEKAFAPAESIVNPAVVGYQDNPAFSGPQEGDPAAAKKLLEEAGVQMPYPLTFTYPSTETADKQAAALKETWDAAGFDTTLDGLGDTYYDVIQKPTKDSDVIWGGWGSDWPSAITVTPPLFDSRPNLTENSDGQDYGAYKSDAFNKLVDQAANATSLEDQTAALQQADIQLGQDVAYIPLEIAQFYFLHGSKVTNFTTTPASSSFPDLGAIGVES